MQYIIIDRCENYSCETLHLSVMMQNDGDLQYKCPNLYLLLTVE